MTRTSSDYPATPRKYPPLKTDQRGRWNADGAPRRMRVAAPSNAVMTPSWRFGADAEH
jgi:hypothetical protein